MGEIVNLRRVRKGKNREAAAQEAAERRIVFGRTRAEREASAQQQRQEQRVLDGARLDRDGEPGK